MANVRNARSVHTSVNDLIKATVLDIENILKGLPQRGDRVEVVASGHGRNFNEIDLSSKKNRSSSDTSVEPCSTCATSSSASRPSGSGQKICQTSKKDESVESDQRKKASLPKAKGRIVPDSICVNPLESGYGMVIDMVLSVQMEQTNESKLIDIRVECPDFKPKRLNIGGKWHDVVGSDTMGHAQ
ncbi:hypothetical protein GCK32_003322 [Trichostrongylus colubriformis]|uniref:Uncharacterized protein n=1 Tax=Trichostrongylus colubriformis TaxID=6319 RepID=A0AAN8IJD4_TRICO